MQRYDEMRVQLMQRVDRLPMAYAKVDSGRGDRVSPVFAADSLLFNRYFGVYYTYDYYYYITFFCFLPQFESKNFELNSFLFI